MTDFSILQEDGSCSDAVLEYLCSRHSQAMSYYLYNRIEVDVHNMCDQWITENFEESIANIIIQ